MFWGIDRPEWFLLWSGILGSVISAGVAALVAASVLVRSNRHQRELADEAATTQRDLARRQSAEQRRRAQEALEEQRAQQQQQLDEQRRIAERQLAEQKKEASLAREQVAIAEVIIATEDFMEIKTDSDEAAAQQFRTLSVALARWRAELGVDDMQVELLLWTRLFGRVSDLLRTEMAAGREEGARAAVATLSEAMSNVTAAALGWQGADSLVRGKICEHLSERRTEIEATLESIESLRG